ALRLSPSSERVADVTTPLPAPTPQQQQATQIALRAVPADRTSNTAEVSVGTGASIQAGPAGSISLTGASSVTIDGTLSAPAGAISVQIGNRTVDSTLTEADVASRAIRLGPHATLAVDGFSQVLPDASGMRRGNVLDAGTVTLAAPVGYLAMDARAKITARGIQDTVDISTGGTFPVPTQVASRGGVVDISAGTGLFLNGSLAAQGGSSQVEGGRLSVRFSAPATLGPSAINRPSDNVLQQATGPRTLVF